MKKILSFLSVLLLAVVFLVACGGNDDHDGTDAGHAPSGGGDEGVTEITVMFSKPEIIPEFEAMVAAFNASQDDYYVVSLQPQDGQGVPESQRIRFAAGDAITLLHVGAEFVQEFEPYVLDLSGQPFEELAMDGTLDFVRRDGGRLLGMPATVEGFGLIYNQDAIEAALGEPFDSTTIRTISDLEEILGRLEAAEGIDPIAYLPSLHWSVGWHFVSTWLSTQSSDYQESLDFIDDLIAGDVDLASNPQFEGWMRVLELKIRYNTWRNSPLGADYDDGIMALADGDVGFWFMGDWAYPTLAATNPGVTYGFLPVPFSDDPNDFGNYHLSVDVPQFWLVDNRYSTPEQQEAAGAFLTWMVTSEEGHHYFVNVMNLIPIFEGMDYMPEDPLSSGITQFLGRGDTIRWMNMRTHNTIIDQIGSGIEMYTIDMIDRDEFINIVEEAFMSIER